MVEPCGHDDQIGVFVHRYNPAQRTCRCGEQTIEEPEARTAWGRRKKKPPADDEALIVRTPVKN